MLCYLYLAVTVKAHLCIHSTLMPCKYYILVRGRQSLCDIKNKGVFLQRILIDLICLHVIVLCIESCNLCTVFTVPFFHHCEIEIDVYHEKWLEWYCMTFFCIDTAFHIVRNHSKRSEMWWNFTLYMLASCRNPQVDFFVQNVLYKYNYMCCHGKVIPYWIYIIMWYVCECERN